MQPLLTGETTTLHPADQSFGFELFGMRGLRQGDWKISNINKPFGSSDWQLFNLATDPGEIHNLASAEPDKLKQLIAQWQRYSERVGIVLPDKPVFGQGSEKMVAQ